MEPVRLPDKPEQRDRSAGLWCYYGTTNDDGSIDLQNSDASVSSNFDFQSSQSECEGVHGSNGGTWYPDNIDTVTVNGRSPSRVDTISSTLTVVGNQAANNRPSDCRYIDPGSAAVDIKFKFGPAFEAGPVDVGLSMFTKTYREEGVGSEAVLGFKGILSIQRTSDDASSSGPQSHRDSVTILGFNKDLSSGAWKFQPAKEFKFGVQALFGVEFGLNTDRYQQVVNQNRACGYYGHD